MQTLLKLLLALTIFAASLSLTAQETDEETDPCTTAVLVYLDLSGSITKSQNYAQIQKAFVDLIDGELLRDQDRLSFFPFATTVEEEERAETALEIRALFEKIRTPKGADRNRTDLVEVLNHLGRKVEDASNHYKHVLVVIASDFVHHPAGAGSPAAIGYWANDKGKRLLDSPSKYLTDSDRTSVLLLIAPTKNTQSGPENEEIANSVLEYLEDPNFLHHDLQDDQSAAEAVRKRIAGVKLRLKFIGEELDVLQATLSNNSCHPLTLDNVHARCQPHQASNFNDPHPMEHPGQGRTLPGDGQGEYLIRLSELGCEPYYGSTYRVAVTSDLLPPERRDLEYINSLIVLPKTVKNQIREPWAPFVLPQTLRFDVKLKGRSLDRDQPWEITIRPKEAQRNALEGTFLLPASLDPNLSAYYRFVVPGVPSHRPPLWTVSIEGANWEDSESPEIISLSPRPVEVEFGWGLLIIWLTSGAAISIILIKNWRFARSGYRVRTLGVVGLWLACAFALYMSHRQTPELSEMVSWQDFWQTLFTLFSLLLVGVLYDIFRRQAKLLAFRTASTDIYSDSLSKAHHLRTFQIGVGVLTVLGLSLLFFYLYSAQQPSHLEGIQEVIHVERR